MWSFYFSVPSVNVMITIYLKVMIRSECKQQGAAWRVNSPWLYTDPNEVGSSHCSAAGASGLAVDVHAGSLLSVLQGELHASVQVLQAGNAGDVHGAQPQLLHPCSPPLLPPASNPPGILWMSETYKRILFSWLHPTMRFTWLVSQKIWRLLKI